MNKTILKKQNGLAMIEKTFSHYEITSLLGKGGMGEVYQAKDQKVGRDAAINVLPEEFARDSDRVARFQHAAKLLASLNHANIAPIHGLEESDGAHFLVTENEHLIHPTLNQRAELNDNKRKIPRFDPAPIAGKGLSVGGRI